MLDHQTILNVIVSTTGILGLWALFHWPYAKYRSDLLQNRLFHVRQELFDVARSGAIPFDHPAHGLLRTTINGFIRVGPRLNLIGLAILLGTMKASEPGGPETYSARLARLSKDLPPGTRRELSEIRLRVNYCILCHVVFTSLPTALVLWPVAGVARFSRWEPVRGPFDRVDNAALEIGSGSTQLDPKYQAA